MDELVRSPGVVLTIGPEQIQTTVQTALFRGISEPLHNLLNHTAYENPAAVDEILRHDDKDAFLALVSMAYNIVLKGNHNQTSQMGISGSTPNNSGTQAVLKAPKCPDCKKNSISLILTCSSCNPKVGEKDMLGLQSFFHLQFTQKPTLTPPQGLSSTQAGLIGTLDLKDKTTGTTYPLLHFAKVFALATKYEVWTLQYSAVKAFEKRLRKYANETNLAADELLDALRYLAAAAPAETRAVPPSTPTTNNDTENENEQNVVDTSRGDSISIGPTTLLRSLLRYILVHVEALLQEEDFRDIVVENGIIGLELMNVLKESVVASES